MLKVGVFLALVLNIVMMFKIGIKNIQIFHETRRLL
jgi:hypothetical protein